MLKNSLKRAFKQYIYVKIFNYIKSALQDYNELSK